MGKGGCQEAGRLASDVVNDRGRFGLGALIGAIGSITSTKWAKDKIDARSVVKRVYDGDDKRTADGKIPWATVRRHDEAESCWIVIKNKVYDVTEFAPDHPGGSAILAYGGRDASDVFAAFHASSTWSQLRQYHIGDVEVAHQDPMLVAFRDLRARMLKLGLFHSSKAFYAWKVLSLFGMYFTVAAILIQGRDAWLATLAASCLLAACWQQTGWLAHDFLHHQVFKNRRLNNAFGYIMGNVLQGFSVDWWKNKHNKHHAVPNECSDNADAVDPDIDTLPLLAWHEDMIKNAPPAMASLLRYQQYIFFPVLCFARFAWAQQSLAHAHLLARVSPRGAAEVALLAVHYGLFAVAPLLAVSPAKAAVFFLLAQIVAGFFLALVFVQSHNGMEVYMDKKDFVSAQIVSTRNIDGNLWMDWFSGGLNYQIEHHLFPTLPRHNLRRAKKLVMQFCAENRFVYETCGMDTGTYRVLSRLAQIAATVPP